MRYVEMFCQIVGVDPDGKSIILSMQRALIISESEWVFMRCIIGEHKIFKAHLDNQTTLHVFKNESLLSNIRVVRNAIIGSFDCR